MITAAQYFGAKPHTPAQAAAAEVLLAKVNPLLTEYQALHGLGLDVDPDTGTEISGSKGGAGDGGFRLRSATTGRSHSSHQVRWVQKPDGSWVEDIERAEAGVDVSDQDNGLDKWLNQFEVGIGGNTKLAEYGLYREAPASSPTWCHLTTRAPGSNRRTFNP